jgi:anthranilate phosphoribosyltransferase
MVRVAPVRKQLGFPTVFNALGPLINPAKPKAVIVEGGTYKSLAGRTDLVEPFRSTDDPRAFDSSNLERKIWDLKDGTITERTINPTVFGLDPTPLSTVAGGTQSSGGQYKEASRKRQRGNVQKSRRPD